MSEKCKHKNRTFYTFGDNGTQEWYCFDCNKDIRKPTVEKVKEFFEWFLVYGFLVAMVIMVLIYS